MKWNKYHACISLYIYRRWQKIKYSEIHTPLHTQQDKHSQTSSLSVTAYDHRRLPWENQLRPQAASTLTATTKRTASLPRTQIHRRHLISTDVHGRVVIEIFDTQKTSLLWFPSVWSLIVMKSPPLSSSRRNLLESPTRWPQNRHRPTTHIHT